MVIAKKKKLYGLLLFENRTLWHVLSGVNIGGKDQRENRVKKKYFIWSYLYKFLFCVKGFSYLFGPYKKRLLLAYISLRLQVLLSSRQAITYIQIF